MHRPHPYPGLFIVFEGKVGTGKSTQIEILIQRLAREHPNLSVVRTREPSGELRSRLKNDETLSVAEEVELFAQDRRKSLLERVRPALDRGDLVISDRSFISGEAYQVGAQGFDVEEFWKVNGDVVRSTLPDCVIMMIVERETSRIRSSTNRPDKFDSKGPEYWNKVEMGYVRAISRLREMKPDFKLVVIEDTGKFSPSEVNEMVWAGLRPVLDNWLRQREGGISGETQGMSGKERH